MLWTRLAAATAGGLGLQFVGGNAFSNASSSTPSCSLTGLTGGLASAPAAGDIVIACIAFKDSVNRDISCTTSGYTEIADLYSNDTNDSQLGIYYKVLTAAETSVQFDLGTPANSRFAVHVWRGQNATPLDATTTTATGDGGTGRPNSPSITTITSNAIVIAVGCMAGSSTNALASPVVPSGMENFFSVNSTTDSAIGIASALRSTAGAYDPPNFGGFSTSSSNAWCAATIALRPA